jgi:Tol biopolymer transport system component
MRNDDHGHKLSLVVATAPLHTRGATMPAHRHRRRTAITTALAGCAALVLAAPAYATFPGQNGLIAFNSATEQGAQIFTVRPNGRNLRQITHVSGDASNVAWSPDGRKIAFNIETPDSAQLAIMNADGSSLVTLPKAPGNIIEVDPSFTPNGRRLVFITNSGGDDAIWSMKLDGTDRRLIRTGGTSDPNVSPDGQRIAFLSFNGEPFGNALSTSRIDGSQPLQLTPFSFNVGFKLDWAPDGRRLAFIHNVDLVIANTSVNIATIRPDGTGLRFVTHYRDQQARALFGSYSPDGRWIVFRLEANGQFGLYKVHPDGTHLRPILGLSDFAPRYIAWGARTRHGGDEPGGSR